MINGLSIKAAQQQGSGGCLLHFHRVAPAKDWDNLPNRNFYLSADFLDRLIGDLMRTGWEIITIDDLVGRLERGEDGSRLVNFSVDDCYRDTFELTVPIFRKHDAPVTLFVTTGIPDRTLPLVRAGLESVIAAKSTISLGRDKINVSTAPEKRRWFERIAETWEKSDVERHYRDFCKSNGADPAKLDIDHGITWPMLDSLRNDPLVEIGAHTISHPRVSQLAPDEALKELRGSAERLRTRLGVACRHFAFPYGRRKDCGKPEFDLARKAGFASATTTRKGLVRRNQDLFNLPRNSLGGGYQSMAYVKAVLAGLAGLVAKVVRRD